MNKIKALILLAAVLAFMPNKAAAQDQLIPVSPVSITFPTTGMEMQFKSTMTCYGIAISSQQPAPAGGVSIASATLVNGSTAYMFSSVSVQNRNTSFNVYCAPNIFVSSQAATGVLNPNTGIQITPGGLGNFTMVPGQPLYCINDSQTTSANATVCRGR